MLTLTIFVDGWINLIAFMENIDIQAILVAVLAVICAYALYPISLRSTLTWATNQRISFQSNHRLHLRLLGTVSALEVVIGSTALIGVLSRGYLQVWLENPFSLPLSFSALVIILVALTPVLVGAPMLIFINRFPPEKWVSSRIMRLTR